MFFQGSKAKPLSSSDTLLWPIKYEINSDNNSNDNKSEIVNNNSYTYNSNNETDNLLNLDEEIEDAEEIEPNMYQNLIKSLDCM